MRPAIGGTSSAARGTIRPTWPRTARRDRRSIDTRRTVSAAFGTRATLPADALAAIRSRSLAARTDKPVGDDLYAAYKALYAYDRRPLDAAGRVRRKTPSTGAPNSCRSRRRTDASACRSIILLPKNAAPPYQTDRLVSGRIRVRALPLGSDLGDCAGLVTLQLHPAQRPRARVSDLSGHVPAVRRRRRVSRATIR